MRALSLTRFSMHARVGVPLIALALGACGQRHAQPVSGVALENAVVQLPAIPGNPGVAYFTITSSTGGKLTGVSVGGFARAEMHQSKTEGGIATMARIDAVPLEPAKPFEFKPGAWHVMLFDADGSLKPGATTTLDVTLDNGIGAVTRATITGPGGATPGMDHM